MTRTLGHLTGLPVPISPKIFRSPIPVTRVRVRESLESVDNHQAQQQGEVEQAIL